MKETAVDYLFQKLWNTPKDKLTWYKILVDAKVIEKEQMIEISKEGIFSTFEFEQYYKETYTDK